MRINGLSGLYDIRVRNGDYYEVREMKENDIKELDNNIKIAKTRLLINQGFEFDDICMMSDLSDSEILKLINECEEESE